MTERASGGSIRRRQLLGLGALGTALSLAGCLGAQVDAPQRSGSWSTPAPNQRRVMLLGTIHLALSQRGASGNVLVHDAGDVLGSERQRELAKLTDELAEWEPDRIAVEYPYDRQSVLGDAYSAFRSDDLGDLPTDIEPADEIVQIGCRLAAKLDHNRLTAVDYPQRLDALLTEAERQRLSPFQSLLPDPASVSYPIPDIQAQFQRDQQRLNEEPLPRFYRHLNRLERAETNDEILFAGAINASESEDFAPMKLLTAWYQRNLRIVSNLWNMISAGNERVLLVFGASHVPSLKNLLETAPMFAPIDPKPYLQP